MILSTPSIIRPKLVELAAQDKARLGANARSERPNLSAEAVLEHPTADHTPSSAVHSPLPPITDPQQAMAATQLACRFFQERSHDALNAQANSSSQRAHILLS
jgi:hypothetical protein